MGGRNIQVALRATTLSVMLTATTVAFCQEESTAESLFRQAREEMKSGEPAAACPKFEESYRLDPSIGTLLNVAFCQDALGRTATAWAKLRQFLEVAPAADDRVPLAREKIAELETQLPRLHLVIDRWDAPTAVLLDDVELPRAELSEAIPINPGEHVLRITGSSGEFNETSFRIHAAENLDLHVSAPLRRTQPLPPAASAPPLALTERPIPSAAVSAKTGEIAGHHKAERVLAYGLNAVGVVGLVTSGFFGMMALHDRNVLREQCPNHKCQSQAGLDVAESGSRNATIGNVLLGVGALGLATGGILLWHSGRAQAAASVTPNGASVSVVGVIQ